MTTKHGGTGTSGPVICSLAEVLRRTPPSTAPLDGSSEIVPAGNAAAPEVRPLLRLIIEFLSGRRSPHHLRAWLADGVLADLEELRARVGPLAPTVRSVHLQQPASDVLEVSVVLATRTGIRALAASFELRSARWRLTAVDVALTPGDRLTGRRAG